MSGNSQMLNDEGNVLTKLAARLAEEDKRLHDHPVKGLSVAEQNQLIGKWLMVKEIIGWLAEAQVADLKEQTPEIVRSATLSTASRQLADLDREVASFIETSFIPALPQNSTPALTLIANHLRAQAAILYGAVAAETPEAHERVIQALHGLQVDFKHAQSILPPPQTGPVQ